MANEGMRGPMTDLYNTFVDWDGRLGRELPGLTRALEGCRRVLDIGCGTGRHVAALCEAGFDAYGADASDDMLRQAIEFTGQPERFFEWRLGEDAPRWEPFDAVISLGNVWPQILEEPVIDAAIEGLHAVLKPGGRLVMGLKAFEARRETGNPYMPLLKREHEGEPIWFIRFVDFTLPHPRAEMHMAIVRGDNDCVHHRAHAVRSWSAPELAERLSTRFRDVRVSGKLGDPDAPAKTEDVFVHAVAAS
ncbi:MAG: class I SAM-dependent methyltransferase [Planctomycetota bacterium]|jgi:SAM-dependent methyltransferase